MVTRLGHRNTVFALDGAQTLRLRRGGWLHSPHGRAWLTSTSGSDDIILAPGASHWAQPGGCWVIEPLHPRGDGVPPLRIEWQPLPSCWTSWRGAWRHLLDRLRGDAAWDDTRDDTRDNAWHDAVRPTPPRAW